jgi:3-phenylpropionate/trans-cinnamate dioxygenase ferredoxin subunit
MDASQTGTWMEIGTAGDVPEGEARSFAVGPGRVAVARVDGQLYAVQDLCTHDNAPLGDGGLDGFAIQCPRHGAKFDVRTGAVLRMPAVVAIQTFPVKEKDGKVSVALPASALTDPEDDW